MESRRGGVTHGRARNVGRSNHRSRQEAPPRTVPIVRTRVGSGPLVRMKICRAAGPGLPSFSSRVYRAGLCAGPVLGMLCRGNILVI